MERALFFWNSTVILKNLTRPCWLNLKMFRLSIRTAKFAVTFLWNRGSSLKIQAALKLPKTIRLKVCNCFFEALFKTTNAIVETEALRSDLLPLMIHKWWPWKRKPQFFPWVNDDVYWGCLLHLNQWFTGYSLTKITNGNYYVQV